MAKALSPTESLYPDHITCRLLSRSTRRQAFCDNCSVPSRSGDRQMPRGSLRLRTSDDKMNQIGQRVRDRRAALAITQDALCARLAEITSGKWIPDRRDMFRIEDGRRIVSDLEMIVLARALECSPSWLLLGDIQEG